jgi:AAA+ ATPase superfamily predicted ATPase
MSLASRPKEQEGLERFYQSERSEFLALYGRRRVGKTFLIKHFFDRKKCAFFHFTGIKDGPLKDQVSRFTKAISDTFYKGSEIKKRSSWLEAFDALTDAINKHVEKGKKVVLFLDEFPWMATHKSKLLQTLDHFWNHYWSHDPRVKLVICGSSASWIINKIINNRGGLHNRVTRKILLKPFTLSETKKFLVAKGIRLNNWQIAQIYMVTGGVPFYLSFVEKGMSSAQAIESLAFSENSLLLKEFDNLFSSLFENPEPYIELLRIIAKNRYGISQAKLTKKSIHFSKGGRISSALKELKEAGFILGFKPHQHKKKGLSYRIIDEYTLFYFYWIEPIRDTLQEQSLEPGYWQELQTSPSWNSWAGYSFEAMVYKHLPEIRKKLKIPATAIANSWRYMAAKLSKEDGAQIDLLFDRRDGTITLCEIKLTINPFIIDKHYAAQLIKKRDIFVKMTGTKKQIFIAMISANGIKNNPYSDALIQNVVTMDDLFIGQRK